MQLENQVALITGAASGIGLATARLFAREGAAVVLTDIQDEAGEAAAHALRAAGHQAIYCHADVRNAQAMGEAVQACERAFGRLDVLFNNAGRTDIETFENTTDETWREMIDIHLTGVFIGTRQCLPLMKRSAAGAVINHASVDSLWGNPSIAAYSAAKGGLIPLTHVMAHNLARYNIRVNSISSGGIRTAMSRGKDAVTAARIAVTPLKRMGTADEVAQVALFFASPASSFVNGANLVVDGGRTAITQGCFDA